MSAPTDLSDVALAKLHAGDPVQAAVYARLAGAQQTKASNLIAYLNSDRQSWSLEDESLVRSYLGLGDAPDDIADPDLDTTVTDGDEEPNA